MTKVRTIVIGSGKCGTTTLFKLLQSHPLIFGSSKKETMFFSHKYREGIEWYHTFFDGAGADQEWCESSPQYTFCTEIPGVPERIHTYNPAAKLLYIVREPIARIVSHFQHWSVTKPDVYRDINESMLDPVSRKIFVDRTKYFMQINAYREYFPDDSIKCLFLEDAGSNPEAFVRSVEEFLQIPPFPTHDIVPKHNRSGENKKLELQEALSDDVRSGLLDELRDDSRAFLSYAGKAPDFWQAV